MTTHSSILAWEIHGQETGGPKSTGLQRVGHSHCILECIFKFDSMHVLQTNCTFFFPLCYTAGSQLLYSRFSAAPCLHGPPCLAEGGWGLLCIIRQSICEQWAELAGAGGGKQEEWSEPR